jgi:hypothetical protein
VYYTATALSKYDSDSHMLSGLAVFPGAGACASYAATESTNPACVAHYGTQPAFTPAQKQHKAATPAAKKSTTTTTTTNPLSTVSKGLGSTLQNLGSTVASGINKVLSGVGGGLNNLTSKLGLKNLASGLGLGTTTNANQTTTTASLQSLLNYLLK